MSSNKKEWPGVSFTGGWMYSDGTIDAWVRDSNGDMKMLPVKLPDTLRNEINQFIEWSAFNPRVRRITTNPATPDSATQQAGGTDA